MNGCWRKFKSIRTEIEAGESTTIAYTQYTIGLQLYLLKKSIYKVTESGFQAIKVSSSDVEKWVIVFS